METLTPFQEIIEEVDRAGGDSARFCYQCGKCDVVCPWNRVRDFSIRKIVRQANFGLAEIELEDMWRCTTCGTCPTHCPRGVGQIEVGISLRRIASEYGVFPENVRGAATAAGSCAAEGNPLSEDRADRAAWAEGLGVKPYVEGMDYLFYVGCYYAYDPRMKKVARAIVRLLQEAGVDFGILGNDESCCGESVRKVGAEDTFKKLARSNIKHFIDRGVKRVLVASPHCLHTFKNEYPEFMVNFEVVHLSELLLELVESGKLVLPHEVARKITYHDPCYLGRHNGYYDQPRELLAKAGVELVEMRDNRQNALCCGGGGGRIWMDTPKGERFADLRLEQARETGAELLVTSCPYCISNFEESRLSLSDEEAGRLQVRDITEVLLEALEAPGATEEEAA
ncbi:MAG: (Fe-S)-binding protein [Deltaproteobacteria bacterium]|nr:(Fe-S)-binding protein [Deltaproteobacteria bacterium]